MSVGTIWVYRKKDVGECGRELYYPMSSSFCVVLLCGFIVPFRLVGHQDERARGSIEDRKLCMWLMSVNGGSYPEDKL